jgi:hypothetical protein
MKADLNYTKLIFSRVHVLNYQKRYSDFDVLQSLCFFLQPSAACYEFILMNYVGVFRKINHH